jgi:hypothetical protein
MLGMSQLVQKRLFDNRPVISGLSPTSEMSLHRAKRREVPNGLMHRNKKALFDHLVGADE